MYFGWCLVALCGHFVTALAVCPDARSYLDPTCYASEDIITRDVAVIGGGSTGVYTSVRLRDHDKSIVIVERNNELGGHAQTYTDPVTGKKIDIGVVVFGHLKVVQDYFARFKIPLITQPSSGGNSTFVDFATGEMLDHYSLPPRSDVAAALDRYRTQILKYPSLQDGFNMSYPVNPQILQSFGEWVQEYNLSAMLPTVFATNQGYAPLLGMTMLYMIKYLNIDELNELATTYLTTANHDTGALYEAAGAFLGASNVLLNSHVIAMNRSTDPVKIAVSTPAGCKLVLASKLVSSIPPLPANLMGYDLTAEELSLFRQFSANGYYTGLLNNTGLVNSTVYYTGASTSGPYHIPREPGIYSLSLEPDTTLTHVYFGSSQVLSDGEVQNQIEEDLNRLRQKLGKPEQRAEWAVFSSHAPFNLHVSKEAIQEGFYKKLYALNGQLNTVWTGAAFDAQDSSVLWQFTENYILPKVLSILGM